MHRASFRVTALITTLRHIKLNGSFELASAVLPVLPPVHESMDGGHHVMRLGQLCCHARLIRLQSHTLGCQAVAASPANLHIVCNISNAQPRPGDMRSTAMQLGGQLLQ